MALTNEDLKAIANLLQPVKDDIHMIKDNVTTLQKDTQELKQDIQKLDSRVTQTELTLENETYPSIKIIAEGHLDLNRKLNDILKIEGERILLLLRINHLESEMQLVKTQLNQSA